MRNVTLRSIGRIGPISSREKMLQEWRRAIRLLLHAYQHCRFGSDATERTPEPGDLVAATLLSELRKQVFNDFFLWLQCHPREEATDGQ